MDNQSHILQRVSDVRITLPILFVGDSFKCTIAAFDTHIAIAATHSLNEFRALLRIDDQAYTACCVLPKESLDTPYPRIEVVGWRRVRGETETSHKLERILLRMGIFAYAGWITNNCVPEAEIFIEQDRLEALR